MAPSDNFVVNIGNEIEFVYGEDKPDSDDTVTAPVVRKLAAPSLAVRVSLMQSLIDEKRLPEWPEWLDENGTSRHGRQTRQRRQLRHSHFDLR